MSGWQEIVALACVALAASHIVWRVARKMMRRNTADGGTGTCGACGSCAGNAQADGPAVIPLVPLSGRMESRGP